MGKIELDHTGAGSGVTLSSDGTDLLLDGAAIGGGGGTALELYAENPVSPTAPSATGSNAVAIGNSAITSGIDAFGIGRSASASGNFSVAIGRLASATTNYTLALGYNSDADGSSSNSIGINTTASSSYSTSLGASSIGSGATTAIGSGAMALGGSYASGADSFAAAIANNTTTYGSQGLNSIAMGQLAKASGANSICLGRSSTSSGSRAVNFGSFSTASGSFSAVLSGISNSATQRDAVVLNGSGSVSDVVGKIVWGNHGLTGNHGGMYRLFADTTGDTPEALTTNNETPAATNQVNLSNNSAVAFHGTIVARQQASTGTACAAWKIEGLIRREGSAGTTVLVNSATTILDNTPAWGMTLSANTTNGVLKIEVTGAAATNIRWVATINTSEVTY